MADIDFYGYEKQNAGKFMHSSDYASLYMSNSPGGASVSAKRLGLVQSSAVSYNQNVQPRFEAGSHDIFWLSGQSLGTLQIGRLVGDQGILNGIRHGTSPADLRKGILGAVEMKIGRLNTVNVAVKQEVLCLSGCVLSGVVFSFSVGGFDIQEALSIQVAMVKRGLTV